MVTYPYEVAINLDQCNLYPSLQAPLGTNYLGQNILLYATYAILHDLMTALSLCLIQIILGGIFACALILQKPYIKTLGIFAIESLRSLPFIILILIASQTHYPYLLRFLFHAATQWSKFCLTAYIILEKKSLSYPVQDALKSQYPKGYIIKYYLMPYLYPYVQATFPYQLIRTLATFISIDYLGYGASTHIPSIGLLLQQTRYQMNGLIILTCSTLLLTTFFLVRKIMVPKNKAALCGAAY